MKLNFVFSTTNWHLPFTSTRIKSCAAAGSDFQQPLKGVQGGELKWDIQCSGKNWQNKSSDTYFQDLILWAQFLYLFICRKALNSSWLCLYLMTSMCVFECMNSPFIKITYIQTFPLPPWSGFSNYLRCCLLGYSLHFAPIKLNLQLSHCAFLKSTVSNSKPTILEDSNVYHKNLIKNKLYHKITEFKIIWN